MCRSRSSCPPIEEVVDVLRKDEMARIQTTPKKSDEEMKQFSESFREAPLDKALKMPFLLAHFKLHRFYGPGQLLDGFEEGVLGPWRKFLAGNGFTWNRCYPILFITSGSGQGTYHMDVSHVLAWQQTGIKIFNGFYDPCAITPIEDAVAPEYRKGIEKPEDLSRERVLSYEMGPGAVLWNQLLTPHWVDAGSDEIACSINLSHGGLRHHGRLCPHGEALEKRLIGNPEERF